MIKKSNKIIASLLMVVSLVPIFPTVNAFAESKDNVQRNVVNINGKQKVQYVINGEILKNQWYEFDETYNSTDKNGNLIENAGTTHYKYYFDENGCQLNGLQVIDGDTYYLGDRPATGEVMVKDTSGKYVKYVFDADGKRTTDPTKVKYSHQEYSVSDDDKSVTMTLDGVTYNVPKDQAIADENILENDGKHYVFFFDQINGGVHIKKSTLWGDYYAKEDGVLAVNEWIYATDIYGISSWYYFGSDFKKKIGYQTMNNKLYDFDGNGRLGLGWFINDGWHYSYPDGSIKQGWMQDNENWYYIYSDGKMAKRLTIDGYYVNGKGILDNNQENEGKDFQMIDGKLYYYGDDGKLRTGWWKLFDHLSYYSHEDGSIKAGWVQDNGKWYYTASDGELVKNATIDGYKIDKNGTRVE